MAASKNILNILSRWLRAISRRKIQSHVDNECPKKRPGCEILNIEFRNLDQSDWVFLYRKGVAPWYLCSSCMQSLNIITYDLSSQYDMKYELIARHRDSWSGCQPVVTLLALLHSLYNIHYIVFIVIAFVRKITVDVGISVIWNAELFQRTILITLADQFDLLGVFLSPFAPWRAKRTKTDFCLETLIYLDRAISQRCKTPPCQIFPRGSNFTTIQSFLE